ncbi:LysR substrate-binding domain-containing protein, partial [Aeromonas taiwanensis]|uniref:LysR substrate-binding domain-containing protein n=1 Tax=Aeromonas taiwanensis TaxID=633417 RepID=UPI00248EE263
SAVSAGSASRSSGACPTQCSSAMRSRYVSPSQNSGNSAPSTCRVPNSTDSRDWPAAGRRPLPLAVFPNEGLYRRQITEALDGEGIPWRIAYVSASLASLQGAVSAGIGVSLLPARLVQPDQAVLEDWPTVAAVELALHQGPGASEPLARLGEALIALCDEIMGEGAALRPR